MTEQWMVPLSVIEATIRSAIRVHTRKAGHKRGDVEQGCDTCTLLLAMNVNVNYDKVLMEVPE